MATLTEFRTDLASELDMLRRYNAKLTELMDWIISLEQAGSVDISADEKKSMLGTTLIIGIIIPLCDRIRTKINQIV